MLRSRSDFDKLYLNLNYIERQVQNELPQRVYINVHIAQGLFLAIWLAAVIRSGFGVHCLNMNFIQLQGCDGCMCVYTYAYGTWLTL